ncbi:MAG: DUF4271 domain-containing protein [Bacteroidetes bacterium]|nr:DUF4271 domain-containing protein [Bacteroidota bacterium]
MKLTHSSFDTTYNMQSLVAPRIEYQKSFIGIHELHARNLELKTTSLTQTDWIPVVILFCFILIAWNHVYNPKRVKQVLRAPFSKRFINQLVRDGNLFNERITFTLGIVYLLSFSLLLFVLNERFFGLTFPNLKGILSYLAIVIGLLLFITVKVTFVSILGIVFKTKETTNNYLLNLMIFAIITGPVTLFFLVFIVYLKTPVILYFCLLIIILMFIFRFIRGFLIGSDLTRFSYLLLIVYLCSLEILPLTVALKFIINHAETAVVLGFQFVNTNSV